MQLGVDIFEYYTNLNSTVILLILEAAGVEATQNINLNSTVILLICISPLQ